MIVGASGLSGHCIFKGCLLQSTFPAANECAGCAANETLSRNNGHTIVLRCVQRVCWICIGNLRPTREICNTRYIHCSRDIYIRSRFKHCTTCTCLLGLEGAVVGDVGLVQYLQWYNTWCCYSISQQSVHTFITSVQPSRMHTPLFSVPVILQLATSTLHLPHAYTPCKPPSKLQS